MTRFLFWNVEQFRTARFYSVSANNDPSAGMSLQLSSQDRQALLYRVIDAANPDVIVIVEVTATNSNTSNLAGDSGGVAALIELLNRLRLQTPAAGWRLVPPLWLSGANNAGVETVGVLYRGVTGGVTRYFTGPNLWPGGLKATSKPSWISAVNGPYQNNNPHVVNPGIFGPMLVPPGTLSRVVPVAALHNAGLPEANLAARFKMRPAVPVIGGPTYVDFGASRPPYMVTFTEEGGPATRDLTVFAVHGPANTANAQAFITNLADSREVVEANGANETRIVGGDFNINLLDAAGNLDTHYAPLTGAPAPYTLLLQPNGAAPANLGGYLGYFATQLLPVYQNVNAPLPASLWLWSNGVAAPSYYPRYGFQSGPNYSLDNVLVRPHRGLPYNYQTTILNTVVSSPLTAVPAPIPGNPPIGTLPIAAEMPAPPVGWVPWPPAPQAPDYDVAAAGTLLAWNHYGHIVSTSDHFALFVDV